MNISVRQYSVPNDLPHVIDRDRFDECEARSGQNLGAQVDHGTVLPQEEMENRALAIG